MNFVMTSGGNDSMALIQHMINVGLPGIAVYNNTGWAKPEWTQRIELVKEFCIKSNMFNFRKTKSIGFEDLARKKSGFPMQGKQWCTTHLKIIPSLDLMNELDPDCEGTVFVGVRREESANRRNFPEHVVESEAHGGRDVWAPLVRHDVAMRDELLKQAGFKPLPHQSQECWPCVNANRGDLRDLDENRIHVIELLEEELGYSKKGKLKSLFRPYRHQGAIGIREVMKWANDGKYSGPGQEDLFRSGCDSGFCGD